MSGAITAGTLATVAGIGAAGSVATGLIGANAAGNAASTQAAAANNAANLQYQASQNALGFQQNQYNNSQAELAPWLQSGSGALSNLDYLLGIGQPSSLSTSPTGGAAGTGTGTGTGTSTGGGLGITAYGGPVSPTGGVPGSGGSTSSPVNVGAAPNTSLGGFGSLLSAYPGGTFSAPTLAQAEQMPGYQFQLQQGNQLLQQSAAAKGNLLTGGTAEALDSFGQGLAQTNYQNLYNQAFNTYSSNYNQYENQQTNTYNRLAALAGMGQQTASTLGTLGANAANSESSNILGTASTMGQDIQNAGAANASGIVGSANAYNGAINGATSSLSNLALLSSLYGGASVGGMGSALGSTPGGVGIGSGINLTGGF